MKTNGTAAVQNGQVTSDPVEQINSRGDFVAFANELYRDLREHPESWENGDLLSFLEALAGWVGDMEGYYQNRGEPVPEHPTWKTFAQILSAARVYE